MQEQTQTLNQKILQIIERDIDYANDGDMVNVWGYEKAAKKLEALFFQSQVDLLERMLNIDKRRFSHAMILYNEIQSLTKQIKELK